MPHARDIISPMNLLVDEAIWGAPELFRPLGEVRSFHGRRLRRGDIADADALVVRSVTPVGEPLLDGTPVRFVGAASSGIDHIDIDYLARRGITLADAAGCNAPTVAEYVVAALLLIAERTARPLNDLSLGIVGVGRIGSIVSEFAAALGLKVVGCDPPRRRNGEAGIVDFADLAAASDIVTLHVPLTRGGPDATADMVNAAWLGRLRRGAWLINTSRGGVVREEDLLDAVETGRIGGCVLDVWRGEPTIDPQMLAAAAIATPHIAGQSIESRRRAALMIRDALARHLGIVEPPTGSIGVPPVPLPLPRESPLVREPLVRESPVPLVRESLLAPDPAAARSAIDLSAMTEAMKAALSPPAGPEAFDSLRGRFSDRREGGEERRAKCEERSANSE